MALTFCLLLSDNNTGRNPSVVKGVDRLLLERTLYDPPRAAAAGKWADQLRSNFPGAELIPYTWHLVSHGPEDGLRDVGSRTLSGPAQAFGHFQDTPQVAQAWDAFAQGMAAMKATRVVIRTPPTVAPGAIGRKRIQAFAQLRAADGTSLVWEPEGLWSAIEATTLARSLGMEVIGRAFVAGRPDACEDEPGILYRRGTWLRIDGTGRRPRLSADQLEAIAEHTELDPNSTLVFSGPKAIMNLRATREYL